MAGHEPGLPPNRYLGAEALVHRGLLAHPVDPAASPGTGPFLSPCLGGPDRAILMDKMTRDYARRRGRILAHRRTARDCYELQLGHSDPLVPPPQPGQFCAVLPPHYPAPLLRRPLAYSGAEPAAFSLIYAVLGGVTRDLAELQAGDEIDWIGPLGSPFPPPPEGRRPLLAAGGIGLGPILFLADHLARAGAEPLMVFGARDKGLIPDLHPHPGVELRLCTDDGSAGIHGTVLDAVSPEEFSGSALYCCGPHAMMAAVHRAAQKHECPCWVSMEEVMACSVGACQGCAVPVVPEGGREGPAYRRACLEGPVFNSRDILWPPQAG